LDHHEVQKLINPNQTDDGSSFGLLEARGGDQTRENTVSMDMKLDSSRRYGSKNRVTPHDSVDKLPLISPDSRKTLNVPSLQKKSYRDSRGADPADLKGLLEKIDTEGKDWSSSSDEDQQADEDEFDENLATWNFKRGSAFKRVSKPQLSLKAVDPLSRTRSEVLIREKSQNTRDTGVLCKVSKENLWTLKECHEKAITCTIFNADDRKLITGSSDMTIKVWDIASTRMQMILKGHIDYVAELKLHPNGKHLISAGDDSSIRIWDINSTHLEPPSVMCLDHQDWVRSVAISKTGDVIIGGDLSKHINIWKFNSNSEESTTKLKEFQSSQRKNREHDGCTIIEIDCKGPRFYAGTTSGEILFLNWKNDDVTKIEDVGRVDDACLLFDETRLAVVGEGNHVVIFDLEQERHELTWPARSKRVYSICSLMVKDQQYFLTGGRRGRVRIWRTQLKGKGKVIVYEEGAFEGHRHPVIALKADDVGDRVYSAAEREVEIRVWNLQYKICEKLIKVDHPPRSFEWYSVPLRLQDGTESEIPKLIVGTNATVEIYNLETYQKELDLSNYSKEKRTVTRLTIAQNGKSALFAEGNTLQGYSTTHSRSYDIFIREILIAKSLPESMIDIFLNDFSTSCGFEKLRITVLHALTYAQDAKKLGELTHRATEGRHHLPYVCDENWGSPLDVAIVLSNIDLVRLHMEYMKTLPPHMIMNLRASIPRLISRFSSVPELVPFLDSRLSVFVAEHNEKQMRVTGNPLVFGSDILVQKYEDNFFFANQPGYFDRVVKFQHKKSNHDATDQVHYVDLLLIDVKGLGSDSKALEAARTLRPDHELFESQTFSYLIEHKWVNFAQRYHWRMFIYFVVFALLYLGYEIVVLPDKIDGDVSGRMMLLAVVLHLCTLPYVLMWAYGEFKQLASSRGLAAYMVSYSNAVDTLCLGLIFGAYVIDWGYVTGREDGDDDGEWLLTLDRCLYGFSNIAIAVKFMYFLKGFEGTSALIGMISEIMKDMVYFLMIIVLVTCSFAVCLYLLLKDLDSKVESFVDSVKALYLMLLGDIARPETLLEEWSWLIFIIFTFFNVIVMMNALIAIMGDTYDRVKDMASRTRIYEKALLILEYEQGVDKSKLKGVEALAFAPWIYVIIHSGHQGDRHDNEWEGKIKKITKQIKSNHIENQELINTVRDKIIHNMNDLKKDLDKTKSTMESEFSQLSTSLAKQMRSEFTRIVDAIEVLQNNQNMQNMNGNQVQTQQIEIDE